MAEEPVVAITPRPRRPLPPWLARTIEWFRTALPAWARRTMPRWMQSRRAQLTAAGAAVLLFILVFAATRSSTRPSNAAPAPEPAKPTAGAPARDPAAPGPPAAEVADPGPKPAPTPETKKPASRPKPASTSTPVKKKRPKPKFLF
jgi:outer membrane biosynthesis protein TonB